MIKRVVLLMSAAGLVSLSGNVMAAAFQLWEQDAASIGNYHAGAVSSADDASTAWYNPAGLVRIKNQQFVLGADPVITDFRFKGTVGVNTLLDPDTGLGLPPQPTTAQGGGFNIVPFGHYAAPISDRVVFGFSITVPYGLKTDYGNVDFTRYAATLTSLQVIDASPSLGVAITDKFSIGAGVDLQRASAEFDLVGTFNDSSNDTQSHNTGSDQAWGYHLGALYQFTPQTRVGIGYHSKVKHLVKGTSNFEGQLANLSKGGVQLSKNFRVSASLPAMTTASIFHEVNSKWDVMGSVTYTQWDVLKQLVLQNVAGIQTVNFEDEMTNSLQVTIQEHYRNTWNYSVGANYHPNDKWILRTGLGYDQSPTNNYYRNLQLPDSDRIALAFGAHYQATSTLGFDGGWTHIFAMNTRINNVSQELGAQTTTTNGSVRSSADVFGVQVKWDIA